MMRFELRFRLTVLGSAVVFFSLIAPVYAAQETRGGWEVDVVPYVWFLAVDGKVNYGGTEIHIHESIGDVLSDTNIAAMVYLEARKDRFGIFVNPLYAYFKAHGSLSGVDVTAKTNWWLIDAGGFYRLTEWGDPKRDENRGSFDLLGGVRYWDLDSKIVETIPGVGSQDLRKDDGWVDPFIGARLRMFFNKKTFVDARGDLGGFDLFSKSSKFTWSASLAVGYHLSKTTSVLVGYRALSLDKDTGSGTSRFKWDATLHGPLVAFGINF